MRVFLFDMLLVTCVFAAGYAVRVTSEQSRTATVGHRSGMCTAEDAMDHINGCTLGLVITVKITPTPRPTPLFNMDSGSSPTCRTPIVVVNPNMICVASPKDCPKGFDCAYPDSTSAPQCSPGKIIVHVEGTKKWLCGVKEPYNNTLLRGKK